MEISQYGITWYFDQEYETGRFVNGDYWIVGPVKLAAISPAWDGQKNGSMVNPDAMDSHGYDGRATSYDAALNKALNAGFPLDIEPGSSLVSTIGLEEEHEQYGECSAAGVVP